MDVLLDIHPNEKDVSYVLSCTLSKSESRSVGQFLTTTFLQLVTDQGTNSGSVRPLSERRQEVTWQEITGLMLSLYVRRAADL